MGALIAAAVPLLLGLSLDGSKDLPWGAPQTISLFVVGALFLVAFLFAETRAEAPIIPLDPLIWRKDLGALSASTPAVAGNRVFVTILETRKGRNRGRTPGRRPSAAASGRARGGRD